MRIRVSPLAACLAVGLIALPRLMTSATMATPAPVNMASRICDFQPLALPNEAKALTAIATTTDGMLFVASEQTVWIRGPWGWESAWNAAGDQKIVDVTAVAGDSGDLLVVATADSLHEVRWTRNADWPDPWARLHLRFSARRIAAVSPRRLSRGGDTGPVRGFVATQSGELRPLVLKAQLELGPALAVSAGDTDILFAPLARGWTAAWRYRSSVLHLLGPDGEMAAPIDVAKAITSLRPASVETAWFDERYRRLFIGTDYGLVVADTQGDAPRPTSAPLHVASLGLIDIGLVTRIAGRVVVGFSKGSRRIGRADKVDPASPETMMAIESDPLRGRPIADYVRHVRFGPVASPREASPTYATSVAQVARDAVWMRTSEGVWEWTPDSWQLLDAADDVEPGRLRMLPDGALVGVDLLGQHLSLCVPPADLLSVRAVREGFGIENLIPDPDGDGVWGLENGRSVNGIDDGGRGYLRYFTPHGELPTTDGTQGGDRPFEVARLSWQHPNGKTDWPESERGGLLLPSGNRWLHVRDGFSRAYDWPASPAVSHLRELVPAGQSSTTAWLGIAGEPESTGPILRLDVTEDRQRLEIATTRVACRTEEGRAAGIAADADGHRWLVCQGGPGAWSLQRIHAIDTDPDQRRTITSLPEAPRYLFTQPLRDYVLTDHGVAEIDKRGAASFVRLLQDDDDRGRFGLLAPSLPRLTASVPSLWTVMARRGAPPADTGTPFVMSILANGASLNPLQPPPQMSQVAGWIPWDDGHAPGAVVWAPEDGPPRIEWYDVRSGVPATRVEELRLDGARDAVRFRRADFKESDAVDGTGDLAITSGQRIGMIDTMRRRPAPLAVVTSVTVEHRNGTRDVYDLRTSGLPAAVPHDAARAVLAFASDYDRWWRPPQAQVRGTDQDADWADIDSSGRGAVPLAAGSTYSLQYRMPDNHRLGTLPAAPVALRTEQPPTAVPPWVYALAVVTVALLIVTISGRVRRALLVRIGLRWSLDSSNTPLQVYVRKLQDDVPRASLVRPDTHGERFVTITDSYAPLAELTAELNPGDNLRVVVADDLFARPWSLHVGTPWSKGAEAIVAGQVASRADSPVRPPAPSRVVAFSSLACARPATPLDLLEKADGESAAITKQVKDWGATVSRTSDARCDDFLRALRLADVVHVAAHASLDRLELADRALTIQDLSDDVLRSMRTRLLILSACQAQEDVVPEAMIVIRLVRAGVNVISASAAVDDVVCKRFFVELFRAFLPGRAVEGVTIAGAIRTAAAACRRHFSKYPDPWTPTVDSFQLYGDPGLHFVLRVPPKAPSVRSTR
jgi:hypothetical protein